MFWLFVMLAESQIKAPERDPEYYRVTSPWNALTPEIKRAPTTNAFKNLIDKHQIFTNIMYDFDGQFKNKQKLGLLRPNLSL